MNPDALLCSNTSTLPITELAEGVNRPDDFIGLHFFSPVDKMPLVEIIRGAKTTDEAVAKALDVVMADPQDPDRGQRQPRFLHQPRHRHDGQRGPRDARRGRPPDVGGAGRDAGRLPGRDAAALRRAEHGADGQDPEGHRRRRRPRAIEPHAGRGGGRHDDQGGSPRPAPWQRASTTTTRTVGRGSLWPGLEELFPPNDEPADIEDLKDRYLFIEALETAKCFEEGVIESAAAANIGSIMGIGYPALTGGTVQFMQGLRRPHRPRPARASSPSWPRDELAETYGDRFAPTARLVEMAEKGESFPA